MTRATTSAFAHVRQTFADDKWVKPYFRLYRRALFVSLALGILAMVFASALMFTSGYLISLSFSSTTLLNSLALPHNNNNLSVLSC